MNNVKNAPSEHYEEATQCKPLKTEGFDKNALARKCVSYCATAWRFARLMMQRSGEDRVAQVASSLTFTTVLSLVPLLTVTFALFTAFPIFGSFERALQDFLTDQLMPEQVNVQIFAALNAFSARAKSLTAAGLISLGITSITTMITIESVFNQIWRVRRPRPLAQRILVYWAALTLGPLLVGASLSISSWLLGQTLAVRIVPPFVRWLLAGITLPLSALAFTMLYIYLPSHRVRWRDAWLGGALAALAFELLKRGFGLYIRTFPTYAAVYGAFSAVPIFLLWVYLSWLVTVSGAVFTSTLAAFRTGASVRPRFVGRDFPNALAILARLAAARAAGRAGCSTAMLADALSGDTETACTLLARLEAQKWVAQLRSGTAAQRWVLVVNPDRLTLAAVFDHLAVNRAELTHRLERDKAYIDGPALRAALRNDALNVPLARLFKH